MTVPEHRELFVSATDGLRLHARDYGPLSTGALPVVCLSGLARTAADFDLLAVALAQDEKRPRRVLALDYRGRGRSDWDPDWRRYDIRVELADVLQVLTVAGIAEAVFVGTSRGGLITMALSAARPALLRGAVLNDIGPEIDARGLVRIRNYVGKLPQPGSWREAADILRSLSSAQFPRLTEEQWQQLARGTWHQADGRLVPSYDPNLMRSLALIDLEAPLPSLWHLFEGLKRIPVLALRGANSDVLSAETLERMRQAHPLLDGFTVPDQGHAPLVDGDVVQRIRRFVHQVETAR